MKRNVVIVLVSVTTTLLVLAVAGLLIWRSSPMSSFGPGGMWGGGGMGMGFMREMRAVGTVDGEYDYMSRMIPHHEEAVQTARILAERSPRPELREFGRNVVEVQTEEIDQMREWLDAWYPDRPQRADYEPMMRDLDGLRGDRLDRAFLEDMIPHHMAAVMMSQQLLRRDLTDRPELERFAANIRDTQLREIQRMSDWLDDI